MKSLAELVLKLTEDFNISFYFAPIEQIHSNCLLVKNGVKHWLYFNRDLPENLLILIFFHEVAHIELSHCSTNLEYDLTKELQANLRSLDYLKPFIGKNHYTNLKEAIKVSEDKMFRYFAANIVFSQEVSQCFKKKNIF